MSDERPNKCRLPETIPQWLKPLVGTKFIVTMAALTGDMIALVFGLISDGVWLAALSLSAGAFIAGNAYLTQQAIKADAAKPSTEGEP